MRRVVVREVIFLYEARLASSPKMSRNFKTHKANLTPVSILHLASVRVLLFLFTAKYGKISCAVGVEHLETYLVVSIGHGLERVMVQAHLVVGVTRRCSKGRLPCQRLDGEIYWPKSSSVEGPV